MLLNSTFGLISPTTWRTVSDSRFLMAASAAAAWAWSEPPAEVVCPEASVNAYNIASVTGVMKSLGSSGTAAEDQEFKASFGLDNPAYTVTIHYANGETERYSIWMEDEKSIEEKMKLIERYDLAGVACWRLGLERKAIWEIISKHL